MMFHMRQEPFAIVLITEVDKHILGAHALQITIKPVIIDEKRIPGRRKIRVKTEYARVQEISIPC